MILDATFPPDPRVENEASLLVENGFRVFLFCLTYDEHQSKQETYKGFEIRRYSSSKLEYKLSALAYDIGLYHKIMQKKITHFIQENQIDILHVHDMRIGRAVTLANQKFNNKIVLDLHDNYPEIMQFYPHVNKFPGKYLINPKRWKKAEASLIEKSEKVITVSPSFIEDLQKRFPNENQKFVLVPNAVKSSFFTDYKINESVINKYKNNFTLLYLGDTHIRRGLLTAIESVSFLKKQIPEIKIVIVGTSSTDSILKEKVKELGIENYIDFEGWQNMSSFPSYILSSDIGICPLERNIQHDVAYANKLFQYMSFGSPLLVSNAKAQEKLVLEHQIGLVHQERDSKDFADKVVKLYQNSDMRKEMGKKAKDLARNQFSWEQTSKELITLYQDLDS